MTGSGSVKPGATSAEPARLLLDEMFSPRLAEALRHRKHDVVAIAERAELQSMTDDAVFAHAIADRRWLLTENVKDFRPILLRAIHNGATVTGLLFTSGRAFPRSRRNPGPLLAALDAWLSAGPPSKPLVEDWLLPPVADQ
ncbi:MAG: DUF5615 family PIN-like protein [Micromonosporaceae bacterium]|nr:DUF5615 family PIN-like protein [Micromonosporaceae bacterium]